MRTLTLRQRIFLREYLRTGNITTAALIAYNCSTRDSAASLGKLTMRSAVFRKNLNRLMDRAQLSDRSLTRQLRTIIDAGMAGSPVTDTAE